MFISCHKFLGTKDIGCNGGPDLIPEFLTSIVHPMIPLPIPLQLVGFV